MMNKRKKLTQLILFAMYGAMMFISKLMMEGIPNIHPLTMFIMTFSIVYGLKALIPVYIYVFLNGLFAGFDMWWFPYLYIWALQCIITCFIKFMITRFLPEKAKLPVSAVVYPVTAALLGLTFGVLYAPAQAVMMGFNFSMTIKWIITGLYFDALHCAGNFCIGLLILPMSQLLRKLHEATRVPV